MMSFKSVDKLNGLDVLKNLGGILEHEEEINTIKMCLEGEALKEEAEEYIFEKPNIILDFDPDSFINKINDKYKS